MSLGSRLPKWIFRCLRSVACVGLIGCIPPTVATAQSVWELTPYRIQLILAMAECPELNAVFKADLRRDLTTRIDSTIGATWDVTILPAPPRLRHLLTTNIEAATRESLPNVEEFDKVMLLAVTAGPAGYQVAARELDVRTRMFGASVTLPVWQSAKLCDVSFRAIREAFAPLAEIASVEQRVITMRLRAAGLPIPDRGLVMVRPSDVFLPVIRWNDREGNPKKIEAISWTYLIVQQCTKDLFQCKLYSGIRSPLSGRRRGRVEQVALAVHTHGRPTELIVQSRSEPDFVLVGYDVFGALPDSKITHLIGRTDGQGRVVIPAIPLPVRIVTIKSGRSLLARLPIVPGAIPRQIASIPNDNQRLEAEGFITGLQENLIDLVTRRKVLEFKTKEAMKAGKLDEAGERVAELRSLHTRAEFVRRLEREQQRLTTTDPFVQKKIDMLFADTRKLLEKFLDPEMINRLTRQLNEARAAKGAGA
jgi:hypothetical protein